MKLILASNSPRRKFILTRENYAFEVIKSNYEEHNLLTSPVKTATDNALGKAKDVFDKLSDKKTAVVLGADTIVVFDGKIIGKPFDKNDAVKTLKLLSGNTHKVISGYGIVTEKEIFSGYGESLVSFSELSDELINEYVETGKPLDKAGSYGLQDGYVTVKSFTGSYDNIIGLPTELVKPILDKLLK